MTDATPRKRCSRCKATKPVDEFRRDRSNKDGLTGWCKACWKEFRALLDYDIDPTVREKCCSRCGIVKPVDQFSAYRKSKDGLGSWCRSCVNVHSRERAHRLNCDVDPALREKRCGRCGETKSVDQFDRNRRRKDGLQNRCRTCLREINRDWYMRNKERSAELTRAWAKKNPDLIKAAGRRGHLRKMYGLTPEDVDQMLAAQDGKCAGCAEPFGSKTPHVDHDHETGEVRELLCGPCNKAIGMALESPERLEALARYLRRAKKLRVVK